MNVIVQPKKDDLVKFRYRDDWWNSQAGGPHDVRVRDWDGASN